MFRRSDFLMNTVWYAPTVGSSIVLAWKLIQAIVKFLIPSEVRISAKKAIVLRNSAIFFPTFPKNREKRLKKFGEKNENATSSKALKCTACTN